MFKAFRIISIVEGLSLLALIGAIVARALFDYYQAVPPVGMTHGVLWLLYFVFSLGASHVMKWSVPFWVLILLLSIVPFGFLFIDALLKKKDRTES